MSSEMACAKIGCDKPVTYDRLLCYTHWQQYDRYEIFECERCHRLDEVLVGPEDELCFDCMRLGEVPVHVHAQLTYQEHYLYILKLDGGDFYVGRTNDLESRLQEHRDGKTKSTRNRHPRLVWFEKFFGARESVAEGEQELTLLNKQNPRAIRRIINNWQRLIRLVDTQGS